MDRQQFEETKNREKALHTYRQLQRGDIQLLLLSKEQLEEILEMRDVVVNYFEKFESDGESNYNKILKMYNQEPINIPSNLPVIRKRTEIAQSIFDRIQENYNERFKPEKLSNKNLEKIERLYLFQKFGLFEAPILKGNTITKDSKLKILSLILDINERDIKGAMNRLSKSSRDSKGQLDPDAQKRMDELFNSITKLQV